MNTVATAIAHPGPACPGHQSCRRSTRDLCVGDCFATRFSWCCPWLWAVASGSGARSSASYRISPDRPPSQNIQDQGRGRDHQPRYVISVQIGRNGRKCQDLHGHRCVFAMMRVSLRPSPFRSDWRRTKQGAITRSSGEPTRLGPGVGRRSVLANNGSTGSRDPIPIVSSRRRRSSTYQRITLNSVSPSDAGYARWWLCSQWKRATPKSTGISRAGMGAGLL